MPIGSMQAAYGDLSGHVDGLASGILLSMFVSSAN